jgi:hypothetical protein
MTSARSLRGEDIPITVQGRLSLLTFASPECGACAATMLAVKRLRDVEPDVWFVVAVDGEKEQALKYAEKYGLEDVASPEAFNRLGSSSRPFAVILAEDGTVLGSGVTNTLEQLEALLAAARVQNVIKDIPQDMQNTEIPEPVGTLRHGSTGDADRLTFLDISPTTQGVDGSAE